MRRTVRFADDLETMWGLPGPVLIELGPGQELIRLARQSPARPGAADMLTVPAIPGKLENRLDLVVFLNAIGKAWTAGADIKFDQLPCDASD
jgi:phthiocerol/phenolphthiocerol synthesis type-I polyketide synthase E